MSTLSIQERDSVLVVDSRLIANELAIQHKNFLATIEKYNSLMASHTEMEPAAFETRVVKRRQGGTYEERWAWLTEPQSTFIMTLSRNTEQVVNCKLALSIAFDQAKRVIKQVIPAQSQEIERMKLELQLLQAKQRYLDVSYAIQLSTSSAMLNYLRGDAPPLKEVEYIDRFVDARTGREVGSTFGRSLTQLISDAGLNPKSKRDKDRVKLALKRWGFDYDRMEKWSEASYLRKYPVLEDQVYDEALKAVMGEVMDGSSEQNLFVHQMQQEALSPQKQSRAFQGVEP